MQELNPELHRHRSQTPRNQHDDPAAHPLDDAEALVPWLIDALDQPLRQPEEACVSCEMTGDPPWGSVMNSALPEYAYKASRNRDENRSTVAMTVPTQIPSRSREEDQETSRHHHLGMIRDARNIRIDSQRECEGFNQQDADPDSPENPGRETLS